MSMTWVLSNIGTERRRQREKWGTQRLADGTGATPYDAFVSDMARKLCDQAFAAGEGTWRLVLAEEVAEAFAEEDQARLRAELVQVAAVAVAWVEDIDSRVKEAAA